MSNHLNDMESTFLKVLPTASSTVKCTCRFYIGLGIVLVLTDTLSMLMYIEIGVWLLRPNVHQDIRHMYITAMEQKQTNYNV